MSPNQLIPSQPYTLSYFITDHTDNNTYYVRAVVYDASTGEILDTQNLTRQTTNTRLFSKVAQAPGDSSGHGRRIVVVATAYEDSGYVTKSSIYQEQSENYIVIKAGAGLTLGGGYGTGVDYRSINDAIIAGIDPISKYLKKIFEKLDTVSIAISTIPVDKFNPQPILDTLSNLSKKISLLPTDKFDATELLSKIEDVKKAIISKEITPKTDLSAVMEAFSKLDKLVSENHSENLSTIKPLIDSIKESLPPLLDKYVKEVVSKQKFTLEPVGLEVKGNAEDKTKTPVKKETGVPFDIEKLTGAKP